MSKMAEYAFETDALYDGTEGIDLKKTYKRKNKKGDSRWTLLTK